MKDQPPDAEKQRSEFADSLRRGLLIGAAALVLILPPALHFAHHGAKPAAPAKAPAAAKPQHVTRHADLRDETASRDVRRMANWVADSRDNGTHSFVVLDKANAKVFLFDRNAPLQAAAPPVIGSAIGAD